MEHEIERIKRYIESLNYKVLTPEYRSNISSWIEWYKGHVEKFHVYKMYNGYQYIDKKRASLRMPKRIAEEWSSLLYNDKVCVSVGSQDVENIDQKKLDETFEVNKFNYKFSELLERTFSLGTGATVVYKDNLGKPKIDYIIAPMIFPLRQENGEIVDCAFGSILSDDCVYINIHVKQKNGKYKITNQMAKIDANGHYKTIEIKNIKPSYFSDEKMFQIYKPNIANNIDLFTPYGMSVYANALDQNETIDIIYDSFKNEYDLGKKRLFIRSEAITTKTITTIDEKGENVTVNVPIFDRDQTEFYALPGEADDNLITEINPALRITEHIDGLQTALNLFSDSCGLGPDRFIFRDGKVYTNSDQVISTQSKLYKNILNHEKILRSSITELIKAVMYVINGKIYSDDITIDFDDSIVQDTEKIRQQALLELNNKLIDPIQYYQDVYGMTEKQATEFRNKIQSRTPQEPIDDEGPIGA